MSLRCPADLPSMRGVRVVGLAAVPGLGEPLLRFLFLAGGGMWVQIGGWGEEWPDLTVKL